MAFKTRKDLWVWMLDREKGLARGRYCLQDRAAYARSALWVYGVINEKMDKLWAPREVPKIVEDCVKRLRVIGDSFIPKQKPRAKKKGNERKPTEYPDIKESSSDADLSS